ncbi:signal peptidase II [Cloacibacillus evryensis]|uniref:Signal peptidase II n=1 Tax=Cloacibacillus evryensis TaxID=508460 RepID=A0AAW5K3H3_9BACT|nr:signal peptidase II [Cloacibacillus evryensis]EHL65278.1 hypothetical protein HMPREF1006_00291 [Synergistes sp. 3_1_syn1]MCQ4814374.1 signal peptidase II [Cloacibacillus evryensis]
MKKYPVSRTAVFLTAAVFSFLVDHLTKIAAQRLAWKTSFNEGVSFGLFNSVDPAALSAANIVILFVLLILCIRSSGRRGPAFYLGCGMMFGGTAGNLADRLAHGRVIDWLPLPFSEFFFRSGLWVNAADIFLTAGSATVILALWMAAGADEGSEAD